MLLHFYIHTHWVRGRLDMPHADAFGLIFNAKPLLIFFCWTAIVIGQFFSFYFPAAWIIELRNLAPPCVLLGINARWYRSMTYSSSVSASCIIIIIIHGDPWSPLPPPPPSSFIFMKGNKGKVRFSTRGMYAVCQFQGQGGWLQYSRHVPPCRRRRRASSTFPPGCTV